MSRNSEAKIPILLLKTKNQPVDTYEESLTEQTQNLTDVKHSSTATPPVFEPLFVPVLEHFTVNDALSRLEHSLENGSLKSQYGGMIFTSQRAVEAWADVIHRVVSRRVSSKQSTLAPNQPTLNKNTDPFANLEDLTVFPTYVVGPATERVLEVLADQYGPKGENQTAALPFTRLNVEIHGAETGSGAKLAAFILKHYNEHCQEHWFNYFEAPRLPFVPLLGMSSENYGRKRLDPDDVRLRKKPLLFLVGEIRRDIIPRTLSAQGTGKSIEVEELEVYRTGIMENFENQFAEVVSDLQKDYTESGGVGVIVVFSPQGSEQMLRSIGYLDDNGRPTEKAQHRDRTSKSKTNNSFRWIIASIGPTTRDYLKDNLGVAPDVCADKPNPTSLKQCIENFLRE